MNRLAIIAATSLLALALTACSEDKNVKVVTPPADTSDTSVTVQPKADEPVKTETPRNDTTPGDSN
jgi:hypothetical protein